MVGGLSQPETNRLRRASRKAWPATESTRGVLIGRVHRPLLRGAESDVVSFQLPIQRGAADT